MTTGSYKRSVTTCEVCGRTVTVVQARSHRAGYVDWRVVRHYKAEPQYGKPGGVVCAGSRLPVEAKSA